MIESIRNIILISNPTIETRNHHLNFRLTLRSKKNLDIGGFTLDYCIWFQIDTHKIDKACQVNFSVITNLSF